MVLIQLTRKEAEILKRILEEYYEQIEEPEWCEEEVQLIERLIDLIEEQGVS